MYYYRFYIILVILVLLYVYVLFDFTTNQIVSAYLLNNTQSINNNVDNLNNTAMRI